MHNFRHVLRTANCNLTDSIFSFSPNALHHRTSRFLTLMARQFQRNTAYLRQRFGALIKQSLKNHSHQDTSHTYKHYNNSITTTLPLLKLTKKNTQDKIVTGPIRKHKNVRRVTKQGSSWRNTTFEKLPYRENRNQLASENVRRLRGGNKCEGCPISLVWKKASGITFLGRKHLLWVRNRRERSFNESTLTFVRRFAHALCRKKSTGCGSLSES